MQPENRCPDRTQLLALHRGELDAQTVDMICRHLESCARCESFLATQQDSVDGIVGNLRRFLNHAPRLNQEEVQALEGRAKAILEENWELPPSSSMEEDSTTTPPALKPTELFGAAEARGPATVGFQHPTSANEGKATNQSRVQGFFRKRWRALAACCILATVLCGAAALWIGLRLR